MHDTINQIPFKQPQTTLVYLIGQSSVKYMQQDTTFTFANDPAVTIPVSQFPIQTLDVGCPHNLHISPTLNMHDNFHTNRPGLAIGIIFGVFGFAILVFLTYDCVVCYSQHKIRRHAQKSIALVGSLFPGRIGDQLFRTSVSNKQTPRSQRVIQRVTRTFKGDVSESFYPSKPLAELYPEVCMILCAMIALGC
jgi:hypothetical protein